MPMNGLDMLVNDVGKRVQWTIKLQWRVGVFWSFGLLHTFSFYGSFSSNFSPLTDEPVWAIGTGKVATPETAQNVHATCRSIIADIYDQEAADNMRILYGGSVTPESVDELMAQSDIDGCLVGGASLDSAKFGRIINFQS